jgi:hypothetical protein
MSNQSKSGDSFCTRVQRKFQREVIRCSITRLKRSRYAVKDLFRIGSCRVRNDSLTASALQKRASELDRANEEVPLRICQSLDPAYTTVFLLYPPLVAAPKSAASPGAFDFIPCRVPRRPPPINLSQDFLSPPYRIGDGAHGCRNLLCAFVLCQFAGRQNRGGDQQHALATLIHPGSLALSPYVRHKLKIQSSVVS